MISSDARAPKQTIGSSLDQAALKFVVTPKFFRLLEEHRTAVLTLRARGASYAQIHDFMNEHQLFVSETAIARFCRKNRHELRRLQLLLEQETDSPPVPFKPSASLPILSPILNPTAPLAPKIRDLRGDV